MNPVSAPSYDRFKLIVTIALVVILLLMLLRGCATSAAAPVPAENEATSGSIQPSEPAAETAAIQSTNTVEVATPSEAPSATPTAVPATLPPASDTPTATPLPVEATPDSTATEPAASPTPTAPQGDACNTSAPSRLAVGQKARVIQRLNMRENSSIDAHIIHTNPTGTQVDIIGGPVCTPVGDHAYRWWQIRLANGAEGWSAETQLNQPSYFLEPIP